MKDKWMNIGYEDDELKPYQEPSKDCTDPVRVGSYSNHYFLTMEASNHKALLLHMRL